jgi:hypothetical protein
MRVWRLSPIPFTLSLAVLLLPGPVARSAEPPATAAQSRDADDSAPNDEQAKARQQYILKAMEKYTVVLDGDPSRTAKLDASAMLRWSNPLGDVADGLMSVYTTGTNERPAVISHIYVHGPALNGLEMQEFADVHPGEVELHRGQRKVWSPAERYSRFVALGDGPKPSENPALRFAQIKKVAARFEIIDGFRGTNNKVEPQQLRMLARPTYRYGKPEGPIIDGAVFTFVVATDPEACLLVEIHRNVDATTWQYAVVPMTIYSLDAKLDGTTVWKKPEASVFGNPTAPHYISSYRGDPGEASIRALVPSLNP